MNKKSLWNQKPIGRKLKLESLGTFVLIRQHNNSKQLGLLPKKISILKNRLWFPPWHIYAQSEKSSKYIFSYWNLCSNLISNFHLEEPCRIFPTPYGQWLDTKTMIYEGKFGENATPVYISTSVSLVMKFLKLVGQNQIEFWLKIL